MNRFVVHNVASFCSDPLILKGGEVDEKLKTTDGFFSFVEGPAALIITQST
jgi:hypothetical protein